ncbi:alpha/beta hydrolase [Herbiconiux sp. CPCC 205716]|uniref:Alpha/beta hydrolase n=1 Tax=Herbiconiux gentiana TaxID=2970912 RepID=A0ABT2GE83_9MICO|nr:alpha/beta hydrolase [Herbiconiux gentiana]MCS5714513.1 alpha/beta hydrolase [Herbiconiux gentiana]
MTHSEPIPVQLSTLRWGPADARPAALLLHGLTSSANTWWRVAHELAARGWSVTAPDLRGHGSSPRALGYTLDEYASDVLGLAPHGNPVLGWDLVIGHSLGGAVATVAAARRHHWARSLLLVDPVLAVAENDRNGLIDELLGELGDLGPAGLLARHPRWHSEDATQKAAAARLVSPYVVERTVRDNGRWQLEQVLAGIRSPVHVLAADPALGASFTAAEGDRLASAAAAFDFAVVSGAGHSIQRDDPDRVVAETVALHARV